MLPKLSKSCFVCLFLCFIHLAKSQSFPNQAIGGNGLQPAQSTCLSPAQQSRLIAMLQKNTAELAQQGKLPPVVTSILPTVRFVWPLEQTGDIADPGYYSIGYYVDHDNGEKSIQDYNCRKRTYDGHKGTDIFTWPFTWSKMDNDAVKVVSAAEGTIIGKWDGYNDKECSICYTCPWNGVYVMNTDGSICMYGHLKTGSLTTKNKGDAVAAGEYLGIVGSSGSSTAPHLHFEVYADNAYKQLVDPWAGKCNTEVPESIWQNQPAYDQPSINKIATHYTAPVIGACYGEEETNFSDHFYPGSELYYAVYLRDQQPGTSATCTILQPDHTVFNQFTQSFTDYYSASYWYWHQTLPENAPGRHLDVSI